MRWDQLFHDLDARYDELADAQMMAELADRQRAAVGSVTMIQRLEGAMGEPVRVRIQHGAVLGGVLRSVGPDWILLDQRAPGQTLVAMAAITAVEGLTAATGAPLTPVAMRTDLRLALRGLARDRSPVVVTVRGAAAGAAGAATELSGTIDRVGADFVELAQHPVWEPRRAASVRSTLLVPLPGVIMVRSMPAG